MTENWQFLPRVLDREQILGQTLFLKPNPKQVVVFSYTLPCSLRVA